MICPVCRDEYRPGFTRCATCDVDLVPTLDAGDATRGGNAARARAKEPVAAEVLATDPLVPFCGFLTLGEALQARDAVRVKGVRGLEVVILESPDVDLSAPPKDEYWLRVPRGALPLTVATLGIEAAVPTAAAEADDEAFTCSACGATVGARDRECPGCGLGFEG